VKIISLEAENIKQIKAIEIEPDGSLVVIGGDNAAGKSSALDSIQYALGGASSIPGKPIRDGQKKGRVRLDLGDSETEIEAIRTFTKNGTNLVVKNKEGITFSSPQAVLNKLTGELTFDPLEFSKMEKGKRDEICKKLVGLDFDKINARRKKLFDERTVVNRQGKDLKSQLDGMTKYEDVPDKEVSVEELGKKYTEALAHNQELGTARCELQKNMDELERLKKLAIALTKGIKEKQKILGDSKEVDAQAIYDRVSKAEGINTKVRANIAYAGVDQKLNNLREKSKSLTQQMAEIDVKKDEDLAKAKFPIKGLTIGDDGVAFKNIPFDQCSSAEQIKISVAMGLAMNPKLRVLLIREGSFLDEKNLAMIAKMAEKAGAQIWIERVSKGSECSVIIEDGSVKKAVTNNV
jgi:DNA repair exonuclease SbcCD ATPase subunit